MMTLPANVFIDTSYLIALLNSRDVNHQIAKHYQAELKQQQTTKFISEYIFLELGDHLARLRYRHLAHKMIRLIRQDKSFVVIKASTDVLDKALDLFEDRLDKEWGLTDCTSIVLMRERELTAVLTTDKHFQQAGYQALLKE